MQTRPRMMFSSLSGSHHVKAVLGPTNTGKTHLAVERMLAHPTGLIGLPLRLLAREIYDRAAKIKGRSRVALVTGEEKIIPERPRWFVATAEAMPLSQPVSFLAVDEIQLCADPERGHTFTNRLLTSRGLDETMFMGSHTIAPAIRKILPEAQIVSRSRFSQLQYTKPKRLSRLPKRTAVIAFTAESVYTVAEALRRTYGGTAIVMGALSPSTRNAQVELFQSGSVDYIVATDAIGMGLNMDIEHVVFAETEKFDGTLRRRLKAEEVAQIAGRAGRHMTNGTFSTLEEEDVGSLSPEIIERVEGHRFATVDKLQWRNADLDFGSLRLLLQSLKRPSGSDVLSTGREGLDMKILRVLAADTEVTAPTPDEVRRLWMVCQIPDFQGVAEGAHAAFCKTIYNFLQGSENVIPHTWMARRVSALENVSGSIDDLLQKIAAVRTYTYIAHHPGWLKESAHWSLVTRSLEDKLSLALHNLLTQRFVDYKTSALMKNIKKEETAVAVDKDDSVVLDNHVLGTLKGFSFVPAKQEKNDHHEAAAIRKKVEKALRRAMASRVTALAKEVKKNLQLVLPENEGNPLLQWRGATIGSLTKGNDIYRPNVSLADCALLNDQDINRVMTICQDFVKTNIHDHLARLLDIKVQVENRNSALSARARGLGFRLVENFGVLGRSDVMEQLAVLPKAERKALHKFAVWFGARHVYIPPVLKPAASLWRLALWGVWHEVTLFPTLPAAGALWCAPVRKEHHAAMRVVGFVPCGRKMVRIDRLENLSDAVRPLSLRQPEFSVTPEIMGIVGLSGKEFAGAMKEIGYEPCAPQSPSPSQSQNGNWFRWSWAKARSSKKPSRAIVQSRQLPAPEDSPFAMLKVLKDRAAP